MVSNEPTVMGGKVAPRYHLEQLDATENSYRNSVTRAICINAEIMKLVLTGDPNSKIMVNRKLRKVFEIIFERQNKFGTSAAEAYWYFVEGVPQYLDQKFILRSNPYKINDLYGSYCSRNADYRGGFYANYAGASILHALDFSVGPRGEWRRGLGLDRNSLDGWLLEDSQMLNSQIQVQ